MKKFIISLIIGAVLIGSGIGVTLMEIAQFSTTDCLTYINSDSIETFTFSDKGIFEESEGNPVSINVYLGEYFRHNHNVQIVESPAVEGVEISIDYRGLKPRFEFWNHTYSSAESGKTVYQYSLSCYSDNIMPKDILNAAKYICQNKTIPQDFTLYKIEKVVIKTSKPQLIRIGN